MYKWTCHCGKNPAIFWPSPSVNQGAGYCEKCFRKEQGEHPEIEMPSEWVMRKWDCEIGKIPRENLIGLSMYFRHRFSHLRWYAHQPGSSGKPFFYPAAAESARLALAVLEHVPTRSRGSRKLRNLIRKLRSFRKHNEKVEFSERSEKAEAPQ